MTKKCTRCSEEKELKEFGVQKNAKDGRHTLCRRCVEEGSKLWRKNHPGKYRKILQRANRAFIYKRVGITSSQYDEMLSQQKSCCAICRDPFEGTPHIDHDHTSGKVRGLLCGPCNHMLGMAKDNVTILSNAIRYLTLC